MEKYKKERITDISNELCEFLDKKQPTFTKKGLEELYEYHKNNHHIYPLTNWHAHRLRVLSNIATKLENNVKIWQCHYWILEYFYEKSHCHCHCQHTDDFGLNHDFYHRDSLNYLVYGSQALANACLYLQPFTNYPYYEIFVPILQFLDPYLQGEKEHIEYIRSEIHSDKTKKELGQPFNPNYANTFLRITNTLKQKS